MPAKLIRVLKRCIWTRLLSPDWKPLVILATMNSNKRASICAMIVGLMILVRPARAHHGNAAYDLDNPIVLKGTVTEFVWSNPHVQIYFDVKDEKGKLVHWASETVSPGMLVRIGWTRNELSPGDQITMTLGPAKSGAHVGFALKIVLASGKELKLGQGRDTPYSP
jgi:Family of unknown function (DUF6152)